MLTQVGVEFEGQELILPILGATTKSSLLIRKITGLNPPDLDLFIGDYSRDGGTYQGRRVGFRNIVMTLDLNPNPALGETIAGLRQLLYKAFIDPLVEADYIKINLYDDRDTPAGQPYEPRVLYAVGYTERFETEPFDVETMAQISMICPDPYLRDNQETVHTSNPGWTLVPFPYEGTAETGVELQIELTGATSKLVLANNTITDDEADPRYYRGRMVLNRDFMGGDRLSVITTRGRRSLMLLPSGGGPEVPIVGDLDPRSPWLELHSKANQLRVYGTQPLHSPARITEIRYTQAYWGI